MISFGFESNLAELSTLWERAPEITQYELTQQMTEAVFLLERETVERTPEGIGGSAGLRGSIAALPPSVSLDTPGEVIGLVLSSSLYAAPVEEGSKPHFVPITPLVDWVEYKLGLEGKEARSVAYAISRVKSRSSTLGKHMFRDALAMNEAQVQQMLEAAVPNIMEKLNFGQQ